MAQSLENLTRLLISTLNDVARLSTLLDETMQQADHPVFELSPEGVIWYLNSAASVLIGVDAYRAVGTRLTTYVADGMKTQRRLDALSQQPQPQSWQEVWRREPQTLPCRLTGFAIPRSLASDRPRVILWAERVDVGLRENPFPADHALSADTLIPSDRPILARDLDRLRQKLNLGVHRFCELLGITPVTFYLWRKDLNAPITSRTTVLHLRLLDAIPELAQLNAQPLDLQEALRTQRGIDLSFTDLALLLGVERRAGYAWSKAYPAGPQVQALTASLLYLVFNKPREVWDRYQHLIDRQAQLEGVDLRATQSWSVSAPADSNDSDAPPAPKRRGRPFRTQGHQPAFSSLETRREGADSESVEPINNEDADKPVI